MDTEKYKTIAIANGKFNEHLENLFIFVQQWKRFFLYKFLLYLQKSQFIMNEILKEISVWCFREGPRQENEKCIMSRLGWRHRLDWSSAWNPQVYNENNHWKAEASSNYSLSTDLSNFPISREGPQFSTSLLKRKCTTKLKRKTN